MDYAVSLGLPELEEQVQVNGGNSAAELMDGVKVAADALIERYPEAAGQDLEMQVFAVEDDGTERDLTDLEWSAFRAAEEQLVGRRLFVEHPPPDSEAR